MKDLSQIENSATSVYIDIIPELETIKKSNITEEEKLENSINIVIKALCKSRSNEHNGGISQDYIIKVRKTISKCRNIDDIIKYINNAINKGKNYEKKGTDLK